MEILIFLATGLAGASIFILAAVVANIVSERQAVNFDTAYNEVLDAYQHTLSEVKQGNLELSATRRSFERKATEIFRHYSRHFYGGIEKVPSEKYVSFMQLTSRFLQKLEHEAPNRILKAG